MEKDLIEYIAKALVDNPDAVQVEYREDERGSVFELRVADEDVGKVIGKSGRIAKAIRTLLSSVAGKDGRRRFLEIVS